VPLPGSPITGRGGSFTRNPALRSRAGHLGHGPRRYHVGGCPVG
jgi:hypothetical protein